MHITLLPGATPKKVLSARRVPLRYKKEATKTIKELINRGVITPVKETSDWCSPAFFIPKGDNIRMRLITNYTELNKTRQQANSSIFTYDGDTTSNTPRSKVFRKNGRRTRLLPTGIGRRKLSLDDLPPTTRKVPIPMRTHGTKCILRRVLLSFRRHHLRTPMGKENP